VRLVPALSTRGNKWPCVVKYMCLMCVCRVVYAVYVVGAEFDGFSPKVRAWCLRLTREKERGRAAINGRVESVGRVLYMRFTL